MSKTVIRPYEEKDREAYFHIRAITWNEGRPVPPEDQVFKVARGYVAEIDGKVAGVFSALDFTCTRQASVLKCAAVAGVAVLPEFRRTGIGAEMMCWSVRRFREEGLPIASLYAFREPYYRQFGYEVCGTRLEVSVPSTRYPKLRPELDVRTVSQTEIDQLKPCYESFAKSRSGMNVRTDAHWQRVFRPEGVIYVAGDPVEAYAIMHHKGEFWQDQTVTEVVWSSQRGYRSILSVLAGIGINKTAMAWWEPSDSPFVAQYLDQGVKVWLERPIMYRVTDVPAALRSLSSKNEGEFSVAVADDLVPENRGPWQVCFGGKGVRVERCDNASLSFSVQAFTQAFLGEPSLADLARHGLVEVKDQAALASAEALLPPSPVYCTDFF